MTRDDVKWTVLMVLAVIASLALLSESVVRELGLPLAILPWLPWCRLVTMIAGVVGAKLGNSPLPGKADAPLSQSTLNNIASSASILVIAGLLGLAAATMSACGPKQYRTAVTANTSIAQAIFALQDSEIAAHNAKLVTDVKHVEYKAEILTLLQAGDDLTLALKDWDASQPVPANVGRAITSVQRLLTDLQVNSPQASALLYTVQTVLSVLRGVGVLPGDVLQVRGAGFGTCMRICSVGATTANTSPRLGLASLMSRDGHPVAVASASATLAKKILLPEVTRG
jgi:hypothetical protein